MNKSSKSEIIDLIRRYPTLEGCKKEIENAFLLLLSAYKKNRKLLIAGNGGSAADAEHIAGELMKRFDINRGVSKEFIDKLIEVDRKVGKELASYLEKPIEAIPLTSHISLTTAYMNDANADGVFAQQLLGYGKKGDVFLAISTSGNSKNIYNACIVAKALGLKIIGLTGKKSSKLSRIADITIKVPEDETYKVQELHLPIYHVLCKMLEKELVKQ